MKGELSRLLLPAAAAADADADGGGLMKMVVRAVAGLFHSDRPPYIAHSQ